MSSHKLTSTHIYILSAFHVPGDFARAQAKGSEPLQRRRPGPDAAPGHSLVAGIGAGTGSAGGPSSVSSSASASATSTPRTTRSETTRTACSALSSRRGSASRSALVTPRNETSAAILAKWRDIDEIEDSPDEWLVTPSDFFQLSRHYVQLSDMYLQESPLPNYDEAIEARTRARTCIMGDSTGSGMIRETYDISKGSINERKYFLGIIEDLQRIKDMQVLAQHKVALGREQSMQAARQGRAAARAEIQVCVGIDISVLGRKATLGPAGISACGCFRSFCFVVEVSDVS